MIRWLRLWLLRWQEESLLGSIGSHQALRDLHEEEYLRASERLLRLRIEIASLSTARALLDEALARNPGRVVR